MAVLTKDTDITRIETGCNPEIVEFPVLAATTIYKGAICNLCVPTHATKGYLIPNAAAANTKFVGIAYENGNNSAGSSGAIAWTSRTRTFASDTKRNLCRCFVTGTFVLPCTVVQIDSVGMSAWCGADDNTVVCATPSDSDLYMGSVIGIWTSTTHAVIQLRSAFSSVL